MLCGHDVFIYFIIEFQCPICMRRLDSIITFKEHVMVCQPCETIGGNIAKEESSQLKTNRYATAVNQSPQMSSDSDDSLDVDLHDSINSHTIQSQTGIKVYGKETWSGHKREKVDKIPYNIDGKCCYSVKGSNRQDLLTKCRDGRPWAQDSRSKWSGYSSVRYRNCAGSLSCPNPGCLFLLQYGRANKLKFDRSKVCNLCGALGEQISCSARKYIASVNATKAHIYHIGSHTCEAKALNERPVDLVSNAMNVDPQIKPSTIQGTAILSAMRSRKSWQEIDMIVKKVKDKKAISNEKIKQKQQIEPHGTSYAALCEYKKYTDQKDPFLLHTINENHQYCFKTSKQKMIMANEMCTTTTNPLQEEFCCFDGKVKRCKGHTTLTASVYHPLLQKQVVLATMECRCEDSNYVATFWREFNKAYKKANSIEQKFLPFGWITDMAGSNFNGLKEIYGEDVMNMIKGCEFHFKQSINRQSRKISDPDTFKVKLNLKQIVFFYLLLFR